MFDSLPYSNLRRWTEEGDIYEQAFSNFPLDRLSGIKTLSFLSYAGTETNAERVIFLPYQHTRLDHSLVTAFVVEKILKHNGFSPKDVELGIVAGLVHDIAMPAHGDPTKKIDPLALDEEVSWWEVLDIKGLNFITQQLGIRPDKLDEIIKNKGVLGQVLDIADRITYIMKDINAIVRDDLNPYRPHKYYYNMPPVSLESSLLPLRHLLSQYPEIGNIYKEVGVDQKKEQVFFNNPEHLNVFLLLRAHLYKELYLKPTNQGRDVLIARLLQPLYSRNESEKPLSPMRLRLMTDEHILEILSKTYNYDRPLPNYIHSDLVNWFPEFAKFTNIREAKAFARKVRRRKNIVLIGVQEYEGFDPATSYNIADERGNIMPFKEFNPSAARELEEAAESTKGVFVFWADVSEDTRINKLLKSALMHKK